MYSYPAESDESKDEQQFSAILPSGRFMNMGLMDPW